MTHARVHVDVASIPYNTSSNAAPATVALMNKVQLQHEVQCSILQVNVTSSISISTLTRCREPPCMSAVSICTHAHCIHITFQLVLVCSKVALLLLCTTLGSCSSSMQHHHYNALTVPCEYTGVELLALLKTLYNVIVVTFT
jgi:hypothetical protein